MALGTMTMVESKQVAQGPLFCDRVTLVGDSGYSSGGTTGLKAKLQALTLDRRTPFAVTSEDNLQVVQYDVVNEKIKAYEQDGAGAFAEVSGSQSGVTYKICIWSR